MAGRSPPPPPPPLRAALFFFLLFSFVAVGAVNDPTGTSNAAASTATTTITRCHAPEKRALIEFKGRLLDPAHRLSSWVGEDCCAWEGVGCSNVSGHVLKLDLRNRHRMDPYNDCVFSDELHDSGCKWALQGEISESLLSLRHLRHLDLSANSFGGRPIPKHLGALKSLTYLNLSTAGFIGRVPAHLGNLSRLHSLDLSSNFYCYDNDTCGNLYLDAGWISQLTSLRHLKMNWVDFTNASSWLGALNALPRIRVIELSRCGLVNIPGSLPHVNFTSLTTLNLSHNYDLDSIVPEWLFNITTLEHLDLGGTSFSWLGVPRSIAKLPSLQTLDLSDNSFQNGTKTAEALSNLCNLQTLILSGVSLNDELINLHVVFYNSCLTLSLEELQLDGTQLRGPLPGWLGSMKNLKHLDLSQNSLDGSLPASLGSLSLLQRLDVSQNSLDGSLPSSLGSLSLLQYLDVSYNSLNGSLPASLGSLSLLQYLDVSYNSLYGSLPASLGSLSLLQYLYISNNSLNGSLPASLGGLPLLQHLDVSYNSLSGSLPASLGSLLLLQYLGVSDNGLNGTIAQGMLQHMKELVFLDISGNSLIISEEYLANLSSLKELYISHNTLVLNEGIPDWIPPFQLNSLYMDSCKILPKPQIPKWIRTQIALFHLDISSASIQGNIPIRLPNSLQYLNLSNNQITGHLPDYFPNITNLDMSNNSFSGQLYPIIAEVMPSIHTLDLSMNDLSGSISSSFCQLKFLIELRISKNKFWGRKLLDCWKNSSVLIMLDFSDNKLQGEILRSLCNLQSLEILHLNNNDLSGQIPSCLTTELVALDLSYNRLSGNIPTQIGESLSQLQRLNLRFNALTGSIPSQLSALTHLQILDLSNNNLSGIIPRSFGSFKLQSPYFHQIDYDLLEEGNDVTNDDSIKLFIKGMEFKYSSDLLILLKSIDLSNNRLIGHVPKELGDLKELQSLNLSKNYLTGEIPNSIKGLRNLEVLDLSRNNLSGPIPSDLAVLNFLDTLNLSYNNLSGKVPSGPQLQTFDSSSYIGNPNLCGFPLPKNCTNNIAKGDEEELGEDDEHRIEIIIRYASISLGFIIGFWAICGTLMLQRRWRYAYFRYIDGVYDKIYVAVAVKLANCRRK